MGVKIWLLFIEIFEFDELLNFNELFILKVLLKFVELFSFIEFFVVNFEEFCFFDKWRELVNLISKFDFILLRVNLWWGIW